MIIIKTRRVVVGVYQTAKSGTEYSYVFDYPSCNITFKVSSTDSKSPNGCYVQIDGIGTETYAIFDTEKNSGYVDNQRVEVYYGYDEELSLVFSGTIERVMYKFNQGSQTLMMTISEQKKKFSRETKVVSLNGLQTIKSSAESICNQYGYSCVFGEGDFSAMSIGRYGRTGTLREALDDILPHSCGYKVREGSVEIFLKENESPNEFKLWPENGLLEYPTEDSEGKATQIKSVLIPEAEVGMIINVPVNENWFSPVDTGAYRKFRVDSFTSSFQNGLGITDFECSTKK